MAHHRPLAAFIVLIAASAAPVIAHPGPGLVVTADGTIYFTHAPSHRVWAVSPAGESRIVVEGGLDQPFRAPHHLVLDAEGRLYTASDAGGFVWRVDPDGSLTQIHPGPHGIAFLDVGRGGDPFTLDDAGRIIAFDSGPERDRSTLRRIKADGMGMEFIAGGPRGYEDGDGAEARLGDLHGSAFAWGPAGRLFFTDDGRRVRILTPDGSVLTLAGGERRGFEDGLAADARFQEAMGLVVREDGVVFVADTRSRRIRRIDPNGMVSTVAGSDERGGADGPGPEARFEEPVGVAVHPDGRLVVLEYVPTEAGEALRLRGIDADDVVRTIAIIEKP